MGLSLNALPKCLIWVIVKMSHYVPLFLLIFLSMYLYIICIFNGTLCTIIPFDFFFLHVFIYYLHLFVWHIMPLRWLEAMRHRHVLYCDYYYLFIVVTSRASVWSSSERKNFIAKAIVWHLDGEHLPLHGWHKSHLGLGLWFHWNGIKQLHDVLLFVSLLQWCMCLLNS